MPRSYERIDEDEEVVGGEEPVEDESEEVEDEEVAESGEEAVGKPEPAGEALVEAYIWGVAPLPPASFSSWLYAVQELKRLLVWKGKGAKVEMLDARLKRAKRAVFALCTERASGNCPIYNVKAECPAGLERNCRPFAWALAGRSGRRGRSWYRR